MDAHFKEQLSNLLLLKVWLSDQNPGITWKLVRNTKLQVLNLLSCTLHDNRIPERLYVHKSLGSIGLFPGQKYIGHIWNTLLNFLQSSYLRRFCGPSHSEPLLCCHATCSVPHPKSSNSKFIRLNHRYLPMIYYFWLIKQQFSMAQPSIWDTWYSIWFSTVQSTWL